MVDMRMVSPMIRMSIPIRMMMVVVGMMMVVMMIIPTTSAIHSSSSIRKPMHLEVK